MRVPVRLVVAVLALANAMTTAGAAAADELVLYGAGSLREAMSQIAQDFYARSGHTVKTAFGPSGVMRERIEQGDRVDVFTSADMGHPLRLAREGRATGVAMFARNAVCAFAPRRVPLTTAGLLDTLLDPAIKVGTAEPMSDPLGDYTWEIFKRADAVKPGSFATLTGKVRVLIGGPSQPPAGQDVVATALKDDTVDVFLAYCSGRARLESQVAGLTMTALPAALRVGPEYGVALLSGARPAAASLVLYILSPAGQTTLAGHGFAPIGMPSL